MQHDFGAPAEVTWHADEEKAPPDWSAAASFPTLREALDAIVNGTPGTGHPWVRCGRQVYAPHQVEDLWRKDRML